jgi:drug/metabolite transporter (DMT)-like permease
MLSLPAHLLGLLSALSAAASWGGGDFAGGLANRRYHSFVVLALTCSTGTVLLILLAILRGEWSVSVHDAAWAVAAGLSGGVGLVALFRGLALGSAAVVSSVAGVVGVIVPVIAGAFLEGLPGVSKFAGFLLGVAGIWLVTRSGGSAPDIVPRPAHLAGSGASNRPLPLAFSAGLGFGLFFVLIAQVEPRQVFAPLVVSKATQALCGIGLMLACRLRLTGAAGLPAALASGVLDVGGNVFFLIASRLTSLAAASVLVSMYPVGTVLLSRLVLKEHVTVRQWLGVALCVGAIALIAL